MVHQDKKEGSKNSNGGQSEGAPGQNKFVTISVDGDDFEVPRHGTTPNDILRIAGLDPALRYLIKKVGNHTESLKDVADVEIKELHDKMVFCTGSREAVTVS